jgi:hypothetical protein
MELTKLMAYGCFALSVPQGIDAYLRLLDRWNAQKRKKEGKIPASNGFRTFLALILLASTTLTISFGSWLLYHPIRQVIDEKPCPIIITSRPIKTGPATSQGDYSPANTGSGNTFNSYQNTPAQSAAPKKE